MDMKYIITNDCEETIKIVNKVNSLVGSRDIKFHVTIGESFSSSCLVKVTKKVVIDFIKNLYQAKQVKDNYEWVQKCNLTFSIDLIHNICFVRSDLQIIRTVENVIDQVGEEE